MNKKVLFLICLIMSLGFASFNVNIIEPSFNDNFEYRDVVVITSITGVENESLCQHSFNDKIISSFNVDEDSFVYYESHGINGMNKYEIVCSLNSSLFNDVIYFNVNPKIDIGIILAFFILMLFITGIVLYRK